MVGICQSKNTVESVALQMFNPIQCWVLPDNPTQEWQSSLHLAQVICDAGLSVDTKSTQSTCIVKATALRLLQWIVLQAFLVTSKVDNKNHCLAIHTVIYDNFIKVLKYLALQCYKSVN